MLKTISLTFCAGLTLAACASAPPPPPPPPAARPAPAWVLLGTRTVNFRIDRDVIRVGRAKGRFRRIRLVVRQNAVNFLDLKVVFGNGQIQDVRIRRVIPAGGRTRVIDLAGGRRFIRAVRMVYRSNPNFRGRAVVQVWGRR